MTVSRHFVIRAVAVVALQGMALAAAVAQTSPVLLWDQMSSASGANWGINATADTAATFGYDYSANGIPEAPNSQGGDVPTVGLKLEANIAQPGSNDQISLYPTGQNFSGAYRLSFDAWMNFDLEELILGDAVGTTEFIGGGIGYNNTATDIGSGVQAIGTGDGGSGSDYRVFKSNNSDPAYFLDHSEMAGGSRNANGVPHHENFLPGQAPPAAQGQPATLVGIDGTLGFQWVTWHISSRGDGIVSIDFEKPDGDLRRLAQVDCNHTDAGVSDSGCVADGNVMLFYADFFTSVSPRPDLTFGIVDNVHVSEIPEPASAALLALGAMALAVGRRRNG